MNQHNDCIKIINIMVVNHTVVNHHRGLIDNAGNQVMTKSCKLLLPGVNPSVHEQEINV